MYADDVVLQACSVLPTMQKVREVAGSQADHEAPSGQEGEATRRENVTLDESESGIKPVGSYREANIHRTIPWKEFWHSYVTWGR